MKSLAKAVVDAVAFLELSSDDVVDPDSAVRAMEMIATDLQDCTSQEKAALEAVGQAEYESQKSAGARPGVLEFYRRFCKNMFYE